MSISPRSQFQIQIVEKLATPLMSAIATNESDQSKQAEIMGILVAKSVQLGLALGALVNTGGSESESEGARLALACAAAPVIAAHYKAHKKAPDDAAVKNMAKAMSASLSFADNFAPESETIARIKNTLPESQHLDKTQIDIRFVNALTPLAIALSSKTNDDAAIADAKTITGKIVAKAQNAAKAAAPHAQKTDIPFLTLDAMAAYCRLYAACALEGANDDQIWQDFETKAEMLAITAKAAMPQSTFTETNLTTGKSKSLEKAEDSKAPAPAEPGPVSLTEEEPPAMSEPPADSGNPMAFFKKKDDGAHGDEG